jgi:catechol 2,3-dioxygenase
MSRVTEYGIRPEGYRLPAATRLGRVRLQVGDLDRSLDYYERVLGLQVLERKAGRAALGVRAGAEPLVQIVEQAGARPVPRHGRLGLYHYAILVPDRAALGRFLVHLAALGVRAATADHDVSEAVYLWDPDGLGIEVYADRPRAAWRRSGQELYMTTEPLDVGSVISSAAGEGWAGMPDGTVMGHVHLHVGDLAEAERFYHTALGFDKMVWSYPGALFLSAGGYHHHLGTNTWAAGAPAAGPGDARLLEWEIVLPTTADGNAAAQSGESQGYQVERTDGAWLVTDGWGTVLRLRPAQGTR